MKYITIHNLYGLNDGGVAWYRKQGTYCFDFVSRKEFATPLTEDEAKEITKHAEWYCNQYKASHMTAENA